MTENKPPELPTETTDESTPATAAPIAAQPGAASPSDAESAAGRDAGTEVGTPVAETAGVSEAPSAGAAAEPAIAGAAGSAAAVNDANIAEAPAPAQDRPQSSASKIKIDMPANGVPEPMRPPTRMPKWPSDTEDSAKAESSARAGEPTGLAAGASAGTSAGTSPETVATPRTEAAASSTASSPASTASSTAPATAETPATAEAATKAEASAAAEQDVFVEPSPTTMLQIRPPQEEVDRRVAAREQAANTKPVVPRVYQVLMAVFYPVVLLVLAIRLVTSNAFLWFEYHRPGFPADSFGFSTDDRLTYGSYTVDYLLNFSGRRYLGDLVNTQGNPLFLEREVAHMADVKSLIDLAFLLGLVLAIVMIIAMIYLSRRSMGGVRRGLFAGSIVTLVLIIALGVLAFMGWETFFTDFHKIFFANGTWTFYTDDTLIRLFPSDFWSDSGIFIGAFVLVVSSLTLAFTWPTKDRRQAVARAKRPGRRAAAQ